MMELVLGQQDTHLRERITLLKKNKILIILLFSLIWVSPCLAATYYVRTDGNNSNNGLTNSSDGAWLTIDYAADNASAGDVIRIQAGNYVERVTPGNNGTGVNDTITFVADGNVTLCGITTSGTTSYLRFIGLTMDGDYSTCTGGDIISLSGTNTGLEFWHNTIRDGGKGVDMGINDRLNNSIFIGNFIANMGSGSGVAISHRGDNNLIAYNEITNMYPDVFAWSGSYNRWQNNYTYDNVSDSSYHSDFWQTGSHDLGAWWNLFEANIYTAPGNQSDEHVTNFSHTQGSPPFCNPTCGIMGESLFRLNVWHKLSNSTVAVNQVDDGTFNYLRYYHNTCAEAQENSTTQRHLLTYGGADYTYVYNNIDYEGWGNDARTTDVQVYYFAGGNSEMDYNAAADPDGTVTFASNWTSQLNEISNATMDFNDYANDDFTIGVNSDAIGAAGPLTTVSESDGTGTDVNLADAGFFRADNTNISQYGGNLVVGDIITIGTDTVRITSISGNNIVFTPSISWSNGDAVYFGDDTTPDIGAYPYKAGGYTLSATYEESGGTVTVTPNDDSLVRMVVVFEDGIPIGVDSISPYSVSGAGSGTLDVRVYPLYASSTLWATASNQSSRNVKIISVGNPIDIGGGVKIDIQ